MFDTIITRRRFAARSASLVGLAVPALAGPARAQPASESAKALAAAPGLRGVSEDDAMFLARQYDAALAKGKTTVNLYSANAPIDPNTNLGVLLREFERTFPRIKVLGSRISGAELSAKIEAEIASGNRQGDIVSEPENYIEQGMIEPFDPPLSKGVDGQARHPKGYFVATSRKVFGLVYNTDLVKPKELPTSLADLLVDKWKGNVTITDPTGATTVDTVIATLFENHAIDAATIKKIAEFIPPPDRQVKASAAANTVAQGRYAFALWGTGPVAAQLASRGAPVATAPFKQAVLIYSSHGLLKGGPSPDAAKLLLNWLFSPVAQRLYAEAVFEYPTVPGSPLPAGQPDVASYPPVSIPPADLAAVERRYYLRDVRPAFGEPN